MNIDSKRSLFDPSEAHYRSTQFPTEEEWYGTYRARAFGGIRTVSNEVGCGTASEAKSAAGIYILLCFVKRVAMHDRQMDPCQPVLLGQSLRKWPSSPLEDYSYFNWIAAVGISSWYEERRSHMVWSHIEESVVLFNVEQSFIRK
mgnify:CR=1 FL=1